MSDLSLAVGALEGSKRTTQLPVSAYFDEALFQREQERIIRPGPRYVGHRLAVPERGDYFALKHENEGRALVHGADGIQLVSNVCRHRQAVMLKGRGQTGSNIVGENDNFGRTPEMDAEHIERKTANIAWLKQALFF